MAENDEIVRKKRKPTRFDPPWKPEVRFAEKHHPLFRPPDGQAWPPEAFERIYVARVASTGELEEAPRWFSPDDLSDTDKLREMFGGGVYELRAIRHDGTLYRRVRTNRIAGPVRPMTGGPIEGPDDEAPEAPTTHGGDQTTVLLGMFQWMIKETQASNDRMMALLMQNQQTAINAQTAQMQLLVAALQGQKVDVGSMVGSVAEVFKQAQPPPPPPPAPAPDQIDQTRKLIELAKELAPKKEESVGEIIGAVGQAMGVMAQVGGPPKPPALPGAGVPKPPAVPSAGASPNGPVG